MQEKIEYNIFGSKSSNDYDLAVRVNSIPIIAEPHELCKHYNSHFSKILTGKKINSNLVVVENGILVNCFKGTVDELNNAILDTYDLHSQDYPCFIKKRLERALELKIVRCLRGFLSMYSRTELRTEIKSALRGNVREQIEVLKKIDLLNTIPKGKKESLGDIYKMFAFQIGQTFGLMNGKELYTIEQIVEDYPNLEHFLFRTGKYDLNVIKIYLDILMLNIKFTYHDMLDKNEKILTV